MYLESGDITTSFITTDFSLFNYENVHQNIIFGEFLRNFDDLTSSETDMFTVQGPLAVIFIETPSQNIPPFFETW